jgi:CheY-like chemotaxis protein
MIQTKNGRETNAEVIKIEIPFSGVIIIGGSSADYYITYTMLKRHEPSVSLLHVIDINSALSVLNSIKPGKDPYLILLDIKSNKQQNTELDYVKQFKAMLPTQHAQAKVMLLTANSKFVEKKKRAEKKSLLEIIEKPFSVEKLLLGLSGFSCS